MPNKKGCLFSHVAGGFTRLRCQCDFEYMHPCNRLNLVVQQEYRPQKPPIAPCDFEDDLDPFQKVGGMYSGQILATSAEVTLNGGLVRESSQNPLD